MKRLFIGVKENVSGRFEHESLQAKSLFYKQKAYEFMKISELEKTIWSRVYIALRDIICFDDRLIL